MMAAKRTKPAKRLVKKAAVKNRKSIGMLAESPATASPNQIQIDLLAARIAATRAQQLTRELVDLALSEEMRTLAESDPSQFFTRIFGFFAPGNTLGWSNFATDKVLNALRGAGCQQSAQEQAIEFVTRVGDIFDDEGVIYYRHRTPEKVSRIISLLESVESWDSHGLAKEILAEWRAADRRASATPGEKVGSCIAAWHWCSRAFCYCNSRTTFTRRDGSQSSISLFDPELEESLDRRLHGISKDLGLEGEVFRQTDEELVESWNSSNFNWDQLPRKNFGLRCNLAQLVFESQMRRRGEIAETWEPLSRAPCYPTHPVNSLRTFIDWLNTEREFCFRGCHESWQASMQLGWATIALQNAHRTLYMLGLTKRDDCPKPNGDPTNLVEAEWQFNAITLFASLIDDEQRSGMKPSDDYVTMQWGTTQHVFNIRQAACICVMWKAFENGTPFQSQDYIVVNAREIYKETTGVDSNELQGLERNSRMRDVFKISPKKTHDAWGTMIVKKGPNSFGIQPPT